MTGDAIKGFLYESVAKLGKENMRKQINTDVATSRKYIAELVSEFLQSRSGKISSSDAGVFIEALLHFMFTICLIPSDRKVRIGPAEVDIVIPSLRFFQKDPSKSLIIQVAHCADNDSIRIMDLTHIQPTAENIWIASASSTTYPFRTYSLEGKLQLKEIVVDIDSFLRRKGITGPRLFH